MSKYRATLSYNRRHRTEIEFEAADDVAAAALRPAIALWARAMIDRDENAGGDPDGYVMVDRLAGDVVDEEIDEFDLEENLETASPATTPTLATARLPDA